MPESEHPSLSGIDLSQLSEEELIDAIASAHEKELALESNDKGDAESPFENETFCAWEYVSADKKEALLTFVVSRCRVNFTSFVRLKGLDPNKRYRELESGRIYSGDTLMNAGMNLTAHWKDGDSHIYSFRQAEE